MTLRICIPVHKQEVAPRFDLAAEVLNAEYSDSGKLLKEQILILPGPSSERLCHMILTEHIETTICGGIDQEVYDYLVWKNVAVIDDVVGPANLVLRRFLEGTLKVGDIVPTDR